MTPTVKDAPVDLSDLHAYPWADIEGARIVVRQEIDDNDLMLPASEYDPENYHTEEREGELVGRCNGMGIRYDPHDGQDYASRMGPCIYLETPEGTVLEVRTDTLENELLAYEPPEDTQE